MKKALVLAAVMVIVPAIVSAAMTCPNPGTYKSTKLFSVAPELNGKAGTLDVKKEGDRCVMKFTVPGAANEEWTVSGSTLTQKEYEGTKVTQYSATLTGTNKYVINCTDRTNNKCDGDVDYRNYWILNTTPDKISYEVYGVGSDLKSDRNATAKKRHEFVFAK